MNLPNVNYLHATVLLKQWMACGARRVVISPGSRSTPLALAAAELPELETYVLTDERSAAFFALGLSKSDGVPAILICTSGTAAANYFPAVIEAAQSAVPLIVLTADRPLTLRGSGAPQTMDQSHLYGGYARFFADLPEARLDLDHCRAVRSIAADAFSHAVTVPRGPVHLNVPLDEPLAPVLRDERVCHALWTELQAEGQIRISSRVPRVVSAETLRRLSIVLGDSLCGLIVAGVDAARSSEEAEALYLLSRQLGWPVFADVLSGLQGYGYPVFPHYDIFLRDEELAGLAPDVVLMFGGFPTSKALNVYLDRHRAANTIQVDSRGLPADPTFRANERIEADVAPLCHSLARASKSSRDSLILEPFRQAAFFIGTALEKDAAQAECEALYVLEAARAMPEQAAIVLASSMPVRYADALLGGKAFHVYGLRGVNGIDGTISHAAGIAAASGKPTLLVTGDLAFIHDMNGLIAAVRHAPSLSIVLLNNNGGGIFHFLPVHKHENTAQFEKLHGTPHGLDLSAAGRLFGLEWQTAAGPQQAGDLLSQKHSGVRVIEVRTSREANHRAFSELVSRLGKEAIRL
ncbi:MAG TPA: 2-succinyl-5-enolpyruvyl-6-hydroxy-3-cyclohexene-1-carboxylic-acid synthase [bacterium]